MKVLHLADLHIKLTGPRAEECRRILDWIAENAVQADPDAIVIAGDVFDRRSTPEDRLFLAEFLEDLSIKASTYLINGNHDDLEDLQLFHQWNNSIEVITGPETRKVRNLTLVFLPWPSLAKLTASTSSLSIAERREVAKAALLDVLRGFKIPAAGPSLLVSHVPVQGASMDSGQPVSGGDEIALLVDELLSCGAAGVALGHIHLRQQMRSGDGRPAWYAGAPFRNSFGEAAGAKGGLIWEWNGKSWEVTPWDVPARNMLLLDARWESAVMQFDAPPDPAQYPGSEIRLRVAFPSEERREAREAIDAVRASCLERGALSVTVEERPLQVARTRCIEIQKARTIFDKLKAWAEATGQELPVAAETRIAELEAGGEL